MIWCTTYHHVRLNNYKQKKSATRNKLKRKKWKVRGLYATMWVFSCVGQAHIPYKVRWEGTWMEEESKEPMQIHDFKCVSSKWRICIEILREIYTRTSTKIGKAFAMDIEGTISCVSSRNGHTWYNQQLQVGWQCWAEVRCRRWEGSTIRFELNKCTCLQNQFAKVTTQAFFLALIVRKRYIYTLCPQPT